MSGKTFPSKAIEKIKSSCFVLRIGATGETRLIKHARYSVSRQLTFVMPPPVTSLKKKKSVLQEQIQL